MDNQTKKQREATAAKKKTDKEREDIQRHYDLGNELFAVLLDETMMYSAAYFDSPEMTLRDASIAKLELHNLNINNTSAL